EREGSESEDERNFHDSRISENMEEEGVLSPEAAVGTGRFRTKRLANESSRASNPSTMKQRGRPKGRSRDNRSFGPLGDLIRSNRLSRGLGLADVAKACQCSVQFVSNIEHGRAPLPWEKVPQLASVLKIA